MILLTVGTIPHQFDRLVKAVDMAVRDGLVGNDIFAQIGSCNYTPEHMEYAEILKKSEFDTLFNDADYIISHAGMGTISMALDQGKPILVAARMRKHKEHVNDHQVSTADMFGNLGHVLVVRKMDELPQKISELKTFVPAKRKATPHMIADKIAKYLAILQHQ